MTTTIRSKEDMRLFSAAVRSAGRRIAFVPTMGALHDGHLSLVRALLAPDTDVIASIFVNPTQFSNKADLERYPRKLAPDTALLKKEGAAAVFAPNADEIYPEDFSTWVTVEGVSDSLEGASRPGHFRGVATVVAKLFNIVQPDIAIFGEKDFQQLRIIETMVSELNMPIEIRRGAIIREADGLAMSSRNALLSARGREAALSISMGLFAAQDRFKQGVKSSDELRELVVNNMRDADHLKPDYVEVVHPKSLEILPVAEPKARILAAAIVEGVRLIDNVELG